MQARRTAPPGAAGGDRRVKRLFWPCSAAAVGLRAVAVCCSGQKKGAARAPGLQGRALAAPTVPQVGRKPSTDR
ncbi:hypothetical protein AcdelDRAFT_3103 [Acidovorax delafieldii 2AN]|uniref:Uncharacterized protein n=1 Tax=Acidovorax delafieldii 2AN TaxID=573060 RepID=C5T873_ACIDE|nr:hypothetical protein AcdelDRAFT_3103 [Acidovorax delafieldii 2AN]